LNGEPALVATLEISETSHSASAALFSQQLWEQEDNGYLLAQTVTG